MRKLVHGALTVLLAMPAGASTGRVETSLPNLQPVDWLYPEITVDDDSWRGLLPVILLDTEAVAEKPASESARNERK